MPEPRTERDLSHIKIAHVINPVIVDGASDLHIAQPVTFETMRAARELTRGQAEVELWAAFFPEDAPLVPDYFLKTTPLERSIRDIVSFPTKKKLPLIKDILDRLYEISSADFFIYSNVDIALMPDFYIRVKGFIQEGHDGFSINRRTISDRFLITEDIPRMYATARRGKRHPGFDCFVFKRESFPKYQLGTACLGANGVGRVLLGNIMAFSQNFRAFTDLHLTFHIGDRRDWQKKEFEALDWHNINELAFALRALLGLEAANNRKEIIDLYAQLMRSAARRGKSKNIVSLNSPDLRSPDQPENVYGSSPAAGDGSNVIRQDPIFVVGYPRAGTTLVQALISTQEDIVTFPETHFFCLVWRKMRLKNGRIPFSRIEEAMNIIRRRIPFSMKAEEYVKRTARGTGLSPKKLFEITVIDNLISRVPPASLGSIRWLEKTPHHVFYLDTILDFYPLAKIVYVMRDPEKAILSRRENLLFNNEDDYPVRKHARQWLRGVLEMEKTREAKPDSVAVVRLEDIARDTASEVRRLCDFLGVPFDSEKLVLHKDVARSLLNSWELWKIGATRDISKDVALRKAEHLRPAEQRELLKIAGRRMTDYGYSLPSPSVPLKDIIFLRAKGSFLGFKVLLSKASQVLPRTLKRKMSRSWHYLRGNKGA
jgi:hypothetical protein